MHLQIMDDFLKSDYEDRIFCFTIQIDRFREQAIIIDVTFFRPTGANNVYVSSLHSFLQTSFVPDDSCSPI